jgi:GGDEF domain-containing protein
MKRVATMLCQRLRGMDTVAQTGEEEFTIVLGEVEGVGSAGIVAKALMELFAIPLEVEQCPILLRVTGAHRRSLRQPDLRTSAMEPGRLTPDPLFLDRLDTLIRCPPKN